MGTSASVLIVLIYSYTNRMTYMSFIFKYSYTQVSNNILMCICVRVQQLEDNLEREKKQRGDVEKAKRKLEQDLKATQSNVEDLERVKRELEENVRR